MNNPTIDNRLSDYYESQKLSEKKLGQLVTMADTAVSQNQQSRRWLRQRNLAIAATLLVFAFSIVQYMQPVEMPTHELAAFVSKEIALNHNKRLAPEFVAQDYTLLTQQMDKLDFRLLASDRVSDLDLQLVGARYCSIHGQLATQLKLIDKQGELHTLYQTQLNNELSRLPEDTYLVNGVKVDQWQEGGLFFGFAESL